MRGILIRIVLVAAIGVVAAAELSSFSNAADGPPGALQVHLLRAVAPERDGPVGFVVTNPNPYEVGLRRVDVLDVVSADERTCPAASLDARLPEIGRTVPAGGAVVVRLPHAFGLVAGAPAGCSGARFTVELAAQPAAARHAS